jgi:hypothetical protein
MGRQKQLARSGLKHQQIEIDGQPLTCAGRSASHDVEFAGQQGIVELVGAHRILEPVSPDRCAPLELIERHEHTLGGESSQRGVDAVGLDGEFEVTESGSRPAQ